MSFFSQTPHLNRGEIHVWTTRDQPIQDQALLALYRSWLSDDEALRMARFVFERHRHQYLVTRALLRATLSCYVPWVTPDQWIFASNPFGKPHIVAPATPIAFNLSHTEGLVVLALTLESSVGVDVESLDRVMDIDMADRFFSRAEVHHLRGLPSTEQGPMFMRFWTLKEAYIKACGQGLSIPLDSFSFGLAMPGRIGFSADALLPREARYWRFWQWDSARFVLSLGCVSVAHPADPMAVLMYETVPGASWVPYNQPMARMSVADPTDTLTL